MKHKNVLLIVFFFTLFVVKQVHGGVLISSAEDPSQVLAASVNANILFSTFHVYVYKLVSPTEVNSGAVQSPPTLCHYPAFADE